MGVTVTGAEHHDPAEMTTEAPLDAPAVIDPFDPATWPTFAQQYFDVCPDGPVLDVVVVKAGPVRDVGVSAQTVT